MEHRTTITPAPATATSLSGHRIACTCGLVWTTSLSIGQAHFESVQHLDWHARTERAARKGA